MHRLRKTAIALALGETVAFGSSAPATAQPAAQPATERAPSDRTDPSQGAAQTSANASSAPGAAKIPPSNISGGYTWRNKPPPPRKSGHRHAPKVDPSRPQAKGPEFVIGPDGTSYISLQVSQRVEVSLTTHTNQLIFDLPTAQVAVPNDSNPLVTTHFATPVRSVRLSSYGKNARLIIELREASSPVYQLRPLPAGAVSLEISLPKPSHGARSPRVEPKQKAHPTRSKPRN